MNKKTTGLESKIRRAIEAQLADDSSEPAFAERVSFLRSLLALPDDQFMSGFLAAIGENFLVVESILYSLSKKDLMTIVSHYPLSRKSAAKFLGSVAVYHMVDIPMVKAVFKYHGKVLEESDCLEAIDSAVLIIKLTENTKTRVKAEKIIDVFRAAAPTAVMEYVLNQGNGSHSVRNSSEVFKKR